MPSAIHNRVATLRRTDLFRDFPEDELVEIAHHAIARRFRRDERLAIEGEPAKGLYVLVEGSVRIFREAWDGREQVLRIDRAIASLAELPFLDGGPHPASISACCECQTLWLHFPGSGLKWKSSPQFATNALEIMARRVREAVELVHALSLLHVDQRVAQYLLNTAESSGAASFELEMSNQQIGAIVGAVREVISRSLSKLQRDGLIQLEGRKVSILDSDSMREFVRSHRDRTERAFTAKA